MSTDPRKTSRTGEAQGLTRHELPGIARSPPATATAEATAVTTAVSSLSSDYAELTALVSQFNVQLATMKDNVQKLTESLPAQARLTTLWEEQAREWEIEKNDREESG
jgi:hypothetical protein